MYFVVCFKTVINVELSKYIIYLFFDVVLLLYWIFDVRRLVYIQLKLLIQNSLSLSLAHFGASSHPSHFTTMEGFPVSSIWTGGWMGPRLVQAFGRRNNLLPLLANAPQFLGNPAHSLVTILATLAQRATYFHCIPSFVLLDDLQHCQKNYFYQLLSS